MLRDAETQTFWLIGRVATSRAPVKGRIKAQCSHTGPKPDAVAQVRP